MTATGTELSPLMSVQNADNVAITGGTVAGLSSMGLTPANYTTAGSSQTDATAITTAVAFVTVNTSVSTKGVRLPTAVTGKMVWICNASTTFAFKIYPGTNAKIGTNATNLTDTTLAKNKTNQYIAQNTTYWAVQRGA